CMTTDCRVSKDKVYLMGSKSDMRTRATQQREDNEHLHHDIVTARRNIFQFGAPPEGASVEGILGATSSTPIRSAFSTRLAQFGFDVYRMLVPDLLHEFELGVWKATIIHLVRILIAAGGRCVQEMDSRYSKVPTFGRNTIRKFGANVSGFKKLAARDYEDLLQCAIPVFEGLLSPRFDAIVLDLLFTLATWHALAKLRLHSESTLNRLEQATTVLGDTLRKFKRKVCGAFSTKELPKETIARFRRVKAGSKGTAATPGCTKTKVFNMSTYKLHRLGDYATTIRHFGTVENTTTQTSELEHRRLKRFYARTNKNMKFARQIARHQWREQLLNAIHRRMTGQPSKKNAKAQKLRARHHRPLHLGFEDSEALPPTSAKMHAQISEEQAHPVDISEYIRENRDDPAFKDFYHKLQVHAYKRLSESRTGQALDGDISSEHLRNLRLVRNRMYLHKVLRINYTSYDMRREQDSINPRSHADVLMLAPPGEAHPYLYARLVSIFHVNAVLLDPGSDTEEPEPELIHILWARWFELDTTHRAGFEARRLFRLRFANLNEDAFTFIAPSQILRGVHLIPAFNYGRTNIALPYSSITRGEDDGEGGEDYKYYYVGIFSDRDLFMRYLGGGVGHQPCKPAADSAASLEVSGDDTEDVVLAARAEELTDRDDDSSGNESSEEDPMHGYYPSGDDGEDDEDSEDAPGPEAEDEGEETIEQHELEDLGPEDGEGDDGIDDYEDCGFAPL
ncbi:hypothetical protein GY45DRAFT_1264953, partial [Cubamyces sp. BRFM 1775]